MSLPPYFHSPEDYFTDSIEFFEQYERLYNFANTDILVHNVLDQFDDVDFKMADIFDENFELSEEIRNNEFLKTFFEKITKFKVQYEDIETDNSLDVNIDVPLSPKKKHEIIYLARELKECCDDTDCKTVVDFGSGLGYLDQLIYETTNLNVLGVECNENHYVGAKKRQRKYHLDSIDKVKYIKHMINEHSDEKIQEYLVEKFKDFNIFCITGLHACADLAVDGINLFLKMADAKALVLMPCCYHKMARDNPNSEEIIFKNFPLSKCLKEIFKRHEGFKFMRIPFLRLAAQPPKLEEKLKDLVFNLLARATLQLYAFRHNYTLKRKKRKAVKIKTLHNDFSNYVDDAAKGFTITRVNIPTDSENSTYNGEIMKIDFDFEELHSIWRETQKLTQKAAIFILLQNNLQPVIENFVLYDRIVYLKENGVEKCSYKKIFDEKISPRCLTLVSIK